MSFKFWLNEMFIHGKPSKENTYVIAFRSDIWLITDASKNQFKSIYEKIISQHPLLKNDNSEIYDVDDAHDFVQEIGDKVADIIVGQLIDKKLYIMKIGDIYPATSPLAKKVAEALGITFVKSEFALDYGFDRGFKKKEISGNLPEELYHGTSLSYLNDILNKGLMPRSITRVDSNYKTINHYDSVFLTADFNNAVYHSTNANGKSNVSIVVKFSIPDKSKIIPDYDADKNASGKSTYGYGEPQKHQSSYSVPPLKTINHSGNIGYSGRISPSFIKEIYLINHINNKITKIKGNRINALKNRLKRYGTDAFYFYGLEI